MKRNMQNSIMYLIHIGNDVVRSIWENGWDKKITPLVLFFYLIVSFNSFFKRAISWVKFLLDSTNLESRIVWESASKNSRIMATRKIILEASWIPRHLHKKVRIDGNKSMISKQKSTIIQESTYLISSFFFKTERSSL